MDKIERIYSCGDVAERYGLTVETIYRMAKYGDIPHLRIGKKVLFRESDLLEFERANAKNVRSDD